ncbi:DUF427 domain-containing protein [Curtobacterium flaccumfaciens]|nr:DUF427 domain-containing protein [Curtobacterium flaccumfaciens]
MGTEQPLGPRRRRRRHRRRHPLADPGLGGRAEGARVRHPGRRRPYRPAPPRRGRPAPGRSWRPVRPARRWYHLALSDRLVEHVAWAWDEDGLDGWLGVTWTPGVLDAWYEEDDPVITHPRDPHNRVDALPSSRHVVVRDGDRVLADTTAPVAVYETGLPTRWYVPPADVRFDAIVETDTVSECPYKGHATEYWGVRRPDGSVQDVAWSYPDPFPAVAAVRGLVAFWGERVTVEVDGEPQHAVVDLRV